MIDDYRHHNTKHWQASAVQQVAKVDRQSASQLVERARAVAQETARICAQSAVIVEQGQMLVQAAIETRNQLQAKGTVRPTPRAVLRNIRPLPLTPPMLLELADEFSMLAETAECPSSRFAFHDLAFRYTALAMGFDTQHNPSDRLH